MKHKCKDRPKKLRKLLAIICWIFEHKKYGITIIEPKKPQESIVIYTCGRCGQIYKTEKLIYDKC